MPDAGPDNPYDFRSPVRNRHLLAGRAEELERIDTLMRAAAAGRPTHLAIFGDAGCGKSSLLNAVAEIARTRSLLPIQITLRAATVASELGFYREVFDTALQALVSMGRLPKDSDVMNQWLHQTRLGEAVLRSGVPALEVGLLAAAALSGKLVADIPIPGLQRDLALLLSLADSPALRGIALCFDDAEYINNSTDVAQSLSALAGSYQTLAVVTASATAGALQAIAPRAWDQIEVKPLNDLSAVFEAMTKPLEFAREPGLAPGVSTASDVRALTRGQPFEVNLVCHFMWEAVRSGEQPGLDLSLSVIERLLAELEEKGRRDTISAIATLADLSSAEYEILGRVAPYERLTVHQAALISLMLQDFTETELAETEEAIRVDLQALEARGVLTIQDDRFSISGGNDARLYAKYALRRRNSTRMDYLFSYARKATLTCGDKLGEALVGPAYPEALMVGGGVPHEVGGVLAGRWLNELCNAAQEGGLPVLEGWCETGVVGRWPVSGVWWGAPVAGGSGGRVSAGRQRWGALGA